MAGAGRWFVLAVCCCAASCSQVFADTSAQPPNIVLILVDDQGWTDTAVRMDPTVPQSASDFYQTPNLVALASQGMRFSNAYSAGPVCSPTRAAIQTGKSPAALQMSGLTTAGVSSNPNFAYEQNQWLSTPVPRTSLPERETTIAEHLRAGRPDFATAHFGKWHLNIGYPWQQDRHGYEAGGALPTTNADPKATQAITQAANQFMASAVAANRPFFVQVSYEADHLPALATQPTIDKYLALPPGQRHFNPVYAAMNEELDSGVGGLMQQLRDLGVEDNTYVFYTSDNGGARTEQTTVNDPLFAGKWSLYEGGVRVPFFAKGPGIAPGSVADAPVISMDLFPTFSKLAGIEEPLPNGLEGADLSPVLFNGGDLPEDMSSLVRAYGDQGELFFHYPHQTQPASAIRDGDYKLIRFYGRPAPPSEVLLFNLAENLAESSNPRAPVNLARTRPEVVAALEAKLDHWLAAVDASFAYDVATPVSMEWNAAGPVNDLLAWRSSTDVQSRPREEWTRSDGAAVSRVAVAPSQPYLPRAAIDFDGQQKLVRQYFHVSTPVNEPRDHNHSATFEMWVRLDGLDRQQTLFESGDESAGVSITLGNADGIGGSNDLRFRVLGALGDQLTATIPFDRFADPVRDFVQIVGVINDAPDNRSLELYVNGAQVARADGLFGAYRPLDWDDFDESGLGGRGGQGMGAAGGGGPLPFQGDLHGQIALFRFDNSALNRDAVLNRYNAALPPVAGGVESTVGDVAAVQRRPADVAAGAYENAHVAVVLERHDVLDETLPVDLIVAGNDSCCVAAGTPPVPGELPAYTPFASYLLHFDPAGAPAAAEVVSGSVTFAAPILGVLLDSTSLAATDRLLGSLGGYPVGSRGMDISVGDLLTISPDRRTLGLSWQALQDELVQIRVLTARSLTGLAPADFLPDGYIDQWDLSAPGIGWAARFGGDLDGRDLLAWQREFGVAAAQAKSAAASFAVPEIGGVSLACCAAAAAATQRNKKARRRTAAPQPQ